MNGLADEQERERFSTELNRNFSVVASAGSGKTRAITDRIVQIARNPKALEWLPQLVVVTFTHRAAEEMQQRARRQILEAGLNVEVIAAFNRAFFGTIHSFCVKLLGAHGHYLGLPATFDLVTDDEDLWNDFVQRQTVIGRSLSPTNRAALLRHVQVRELMELGRRGGVDGDASAEPGDCPELDLTALYAFAPGKRSRRRITQVQSELREWEKALRSGTDFLPLPQNSSSAKAFVALWREVFGALRGWLNCCSLSVAAEVERAYREVRLSRGALTYDDQIALAELLLQNPDAARRIRSTNYRVILDEAQDTSPRQFSVLLEVARPVDAQFGWPAAAADPPRAGHFCMVGDFQQSIFGERADLAQYRCFHDSLVASEGGAALTFSVSFRLDRSVLDLINGMFRELLNGENEQVEFVELSARPDVLPGQVIALDLTSGGAPPALTSNRRDQERSEFAARQLAEWTQRAGLQNLRADSWRNIAVLCPRKAWLRTLRRAFQRVRIDVQVQSESDLNGDSPAYAWLCALVTIMTKPWCAYEIVGVLREVYGLSDHDMAVFADRCGERFQIERETRGSGVVAETLTSLSAIRSSLRNLPTYDAVAQITIQTQLFERLASLPVEEHGDLETELEKLLATAAHAEADGKTLSDFATVLRNNFNGERDVRPSAENAIQLITSQKAKGSEWQAVIVPFLSRKVGERSPDYPILLRSPADGKLLIALGPEDFTPELKEAFEQAQRQQMERLLYVAWTRAKHTLVLASDRELFRTARGKLEKHSQMKWLRCDSGECNETVFAKLAQEARPCDETRRSQENSGAETIADHSPEALPVLTVGSSVRAVERAAHFIHKVNPSGLADEIDRFESSEQRRLIPPAEPAEFDNPATRYGSWWHALAEQIRWPLGNAELQRVFDVVIDDSPDPIRSRREWKMFVRHMQGPGDFRARLDRAGATAHAEVSFFFPIDETACLEGIIDLAIFDRASGRCLILDWKTNLILASDAPRLQQQYRAQLGAYRKAVAAITGLRVEAALYSTAIGRLLVYGDDELDREWARLRRLPGSELASEVAETAEAREIHVQAELFAL